MKKVLSVLLLILSVIIIVGVIRRTTTKEAVKPVASEKLPLKGFQISPKSFSIVDYPEFFSTNKSLGGNAVGWSGSVRDLAGGAPVSLIKNAKKYGYTPIFSVQVFDRKSGKLLSEFTQGHQTILDFISQYKPKYFGIGIEVNLLYETDKVAYKDFVQQLSELHKEIHQRSADTVVFTTFQYEYLQGLRGGLFGGSNDKKLNNWQLLEDFPYVEAFGMTTYPTLIYKSPTDMPSDYYKAIFEKTDKMIIFPEIGWLQSNPIPGWDSSVSEQREFLQVFSTQTSNTTRVIARLWSFMYPQSAAPSPFVYMGLRSGDHDSQEVEDAWKVL